MGSSNSTPLEGINITVNASVNSDEASVETHGSVVTPLTYDDIDIFNINLDNILRGATNLFTGPDSSTYYVFKVELGAFDLQLHRSETYNEIKKIIRPVKTEIIRVYSEPVTAAKRTFTNSSSVRAKYKVGVTHEEENTITTTWTTKVDFGVDMKINYKIAKPEGSGDIYFTSSWVKETKKYEKVTMGSETALEVDLDPGQVVVAKLRVARCVMDVRVTYETSLEGDVVCTQEKKWNPFSWRYAKENISDIMKAANLQPAITTTEVLKICFSTDGNVLLCDG